MLEFFMPMEKVPTATHQMKKVRMVKGKPSFYEPTEVAQARQKLMSHLAEHKPGTQLTGPLRLTTKWCFHCDTLPEDMDWRWKATKPDTDNMVKLLKDCMTATRFWKDDAQVCSEITEKFEVRAKPGIYIKIEVLA